MKRLFLLVLLVAGVASAASCSKRVIARINGQKITEDELVQELEKGPMAARILDNMLFNRLVAQEAEKKGIKVSDEEIAAGLQLQKETVRSDWQQYLKDSGLTEADVKEALRQRWLVLKLFVTEEEARKYFEEQRGVFDTPGKVRFRKIVLGSKSDAEQVRKEIVEGKAKFEEVARQKSLDEFTARMGGEVGPVVTTAFIQAQPQLKDVLEKQPLKEISQPVENNMPAGSYQIVEVIERQPEVKARFEDKQVLAYMYAAQSRSTRIGEAMNDMRARATLEILDSKFQSVQQGWKELKERKPAAMPESQQPPAATKPAAPKEGEKPPANAPGKPNVESKPAAPKPGQ